MDTEKTDDKKSVLMDLDGNSSSHLDGNSCSHLDDGNSSSHLDGNSSMLNGKECELDQTASGSSSTHLRTHTKEKLFKCKICQKSFSSKIKLRTHKANRHAGKEQYECEKCKMTFTNRHDLMNHSRIHAKRKPPKCRLCEEMFPQKKGLPGMALGPERPAICPGRLFFETIFPKELVDVILGGQPEEEGEE